MSTAKKMLFTLGFGLFGWGLCGAVMAIGPGIWGMDTTLIVHAAAAPMFFLVLSVSYHTWLRYYPPLMTAAIWVGLVIFLDVILVALLIERSFDMFKSFLGTWLVFMEIFLAAWLGGVAARRNSGGE